ncbi:MAG TPA: aminotransferase class V-fold PLP-dependent enzyme [Acetobacteraceae bacterium]|nr:aminotransferase class V-fold PLP-dependent enzyme [Acetobacteraceae bacterium]
MKTDVGPSPHVRYVSDLPALPRRVLNMSTGPVEVSRRVLDAQLVPLLTPHTDDFWMLHDETIGLLGKVLRTTGKVLMMHGSIRTGIDVALGNLVVPGTRVLSVQNGFWGSLIADWSERRGAVVTRIDHGALEPVSVPRVADALATGSYDLVTVVHVETSSGIVNPVAEIGKLVASTDAIFFVDTACSAGAMKVDSDAWGIDVQVTGSHKCLSAVPGLAIVTISEKAWRRLARPRAMGTYFEFTQWWDSAVVRPVTPPFTQPTTLVLALRAALIEITSQGMESWWSTHTTVADEFMRAMRSAGFSFLVDGSATSSDRASYSDTVMAIRYPDHVSEVKFRRVLLDDFGIFVIGNVGEFAGSSFRVGLMSPPQMQAVNLYGAVAVFSQAAGARACRI